MTSRKILVTGSSRGIGRAVAEAFAAAGDTVAVHHRASAELAAEVAAGLPGAGHVVVQADIADPAAVLALEVYLHRLRQLIAGMAAALDGLDALVFTGGVGEHQPLIRARAAPAFLGVLLDGPRNQAASADADISAAGAAAATLVITSREDIEIARQVRAVLG